MTQNNQSFWDRLMQKLTRSTPVEEESKVKLDHNFDGIEELNNPLPPWWSAGFIITVVISIFYIGFYFMYFYEPGNAKWQETEYQREVAAAKKALAEYKKKHHIVDAESVTLLKDQKALAEGKAIYQKNCQACHAPDGGGGVGPNLTDDNWLYGCDIKSLFKVIHDGTSKGMPTWKNLGNDKIQKVASYILVELHGKKPANPKAAEGEVCKVE